MRGGRRRLDTVLSIRFARDAVRRALCGIKANERKLLRSESKGVENERFRAQKTRERGRIPRRNRRRK